MIPKDPVMLLSYINTQLRDYYRTLDDLAEGLELDKEEIRIKLASIDYEYDAVKNQFI